MQLFYRTSGAFFVSAVGRRLQKQIKTFFADDILEKLPVIFIGSVSPFLAVFEQNNPDIVWESETLNESELLPTFSSFREISAVFMVVSNDSVADNMPFLLKEAYRLLKPQGRLHLLIKNKLPVTFIKIKDMPEMQPSSLLAQSEESGFSLEKKKGLLYLPYNFKFFETADNCLSERFSGGGSFSLLTLKKNPVIAETTENYSSIRMTKASVLTSPRT
ncbi:MAG: hypothetical protein J5787_08250 [Alphaproteobacteria bacterium]|nr:hypothetical protein [Alphaproteobacteria bacterium]MBO4644530.1 hypothetical protein [Alphaproteobacteria bacterium]